MKEIILIKDGELALKGLNRSTFEDVLVKNIRWRIKKYGNFQFKKAQSTITITPLDDDIDFESVCFITLSAIPSLFPIKAILPSSITIKRS